MNADRMRLVEQLFTEASACDAAARDALLRTRCRDDSQLLDEVRSLLDCAAEAGGVLDQSAPKLVDMPIPGEDASRTRVVVALIHGNEPSGLRAAHSWLRAGQVPATNVLMVVAAVETVLAEGGFTHRMLPGRRDLNRCFGPGDHGDLDVNRGTNMILRGRFVSDAVVSAGSESGAIAVGTASADTVGPRNW